MPLAGLFFASIYGVSRLAVAAVFFLAALAPPARARQTISTAVTGPLYGNGSIMPVTTTGSIDDPDGGVAGTVTTVLSANALSDSFQAFSLGGSNGTISNAGLVSGATFGLW